MDIDYKIDDVGGVTLNKCVVAGASAGTVKLPTAANQEIKAVTNATQASQNGNVSCMIRPPGGRHLVTVLAASPNIADGDKIVIHGTTGKMRKATLTATGTFTNTSVATWTTVATGTRGLVGRQANQFSISIENWGASQTLDISRIGTGIVVRAGTDAGSLITTTINDLITAWAAAAEATEMATMALTSGAGTQILTVGTIRFSGADILDPGFFAVARQAATTDDADIIAEF